jgi:hypothetical protein
MFEISLAGLRFNRTKLIGQIYFIPQKEKPSLWKVIIILFFSSKT